MSHDWSDERRREAALRAPMGPGIDRDDTRVVEWSGWYQVIAMEIERCANLTKHHRRATNAHFATPR